MNLPLNLSLPQTQTQWSALLNPILANPLLLGRAIEGVLLVANTPQTLNHGLQRNLHGWFLTDQNAAASVYRTQPLNSQTITLESNATVTINLWVY